MANWLKCTASAHLWNSLIQQQTGFGIYCKIQSMTCDCFKQRQNCSAISKLVSKCTRTSWKISRMANSKKRKHVKQNTFMKDTWMNLKHIKHVKYGVQIFWRTKK